MAEEIAAGVLCLPLLSPQALLEAETNCYIIRNGSGVVVVDPPSPSPEAIAAINEVLRAWELPLEGVVVTHGHLDHIAGVAGLLRTHTNAWVAGHALVREPLKRVAGMPSLVSGERWREVVEGSCLGNLQVLLTPGHKSDHLALWREEDGLLLVGDTVAGQGTVIIVPPEGNMAEYLQTLRRLRELPVVLIGPGHGPMVRQPRALLDYYIGHREARESAILAALSGTTQPLRELVATVYSDVKPSLWGLAEHSLLAHLLKLQSEGRAEETDTGWRRL